jgi:predicted pyridoxine 5'-phosphate oxidase superfamily flavin-nucleotide-binding protein
MPIDLPDEYRDLLDAQVAALATVEPDGTPQLSELWFLHDEGEIRLSLNTTRRKTQKSPARAA